MTRTPSQNVTFRGVSDGDDPSEPPGHSMIVRMRDHLRSSGFAASDEENWRDCGWSIDVTFPDVVIQVALTRIDDAGQWMAQVAPLNEPSFIARLFGRPFVSRESQVLAISRDIHQWLLESGQEAVLWRSDGMPDPGTGFPEPTASGNPTSR